jgi:catechol 2,3-dioxygenase-like lactoylglutathione lyase family enzyme
MVKLEHFAVNVEDPVAMAAWYVEHLGMSVVRAANDVNRIHFILDEAGHVMIEIYRNPDCPVPDYRTMDPLLFHIAFVTHDIEADRQRLFAAGATELSGINNTPAGDQLTFLRDPWGLPLQLARRAKPML